MHRFTKHVAAASVVVLLLVTIGVQGPTPGRASNGSTLPPAEDELRPRPLPFSATSRYFDPGLKDATGRVDVLVAMAASTPTSEVAELLTAARAFPPIGDVRFVGGSIDASAVTELESSPFILAVLLDRPIPFAEPKTPTAAHSRLPETIPDRGFPESSWVRREPLTGRPEITMRDVVNFTGARRAWTELDVDGAGVTIALVDTGVDHGAFNLGESSVARDPSGVPISFDADGTTLAWTTLAVPAVPCPGGGTCVATGGTDPRIYVFDLFERFGPYGPAEYPWSFFFGGPFPANMDITGLPASRSGFYRFGVLFEWNFDVDLFPVLVIDTVTAGVYDTVVLDLSFDWWWNGFSPAPSPDYSFSDEPMLRPAAGGNVVARRDMTGDGYPDISAGSLAHGLDVWGLDPNPSDAFLVLEPLDAGGDFITMLYDWQRHGTFVAASAAGRESNHPSAGPGIAPGATIMGVPVFAYGDIIEGWLWAAGFDLVAPTTTFTIVPNYIAVGYFGEWAYTGNHKADIINNAWGFSDWFRLPWAAQWPWYDVLTAIEDALMTPAYADPAYPGTVFVHAGGNGAAGYGTVTSPGFSGLAITSGASTNLDATSLSPLAGFHGDVMSWSARGPNAYGVPKPDVVHVGAFGWAAGPISTGAGDGSRAYELFGGTSQSTAVTSGSIAVLLEAYAVGHGGARASPFTAKSILKATSLDLGYDPFVQGAGHVNVYTAAAYAKGVAGILATTPATWDNLRPRIASPWASASVFYGLQVGLNPPPSPIPDVSWFAGAVAPGNATTAAFTIVPAQGAVSGTITAVWHESLPGSLTLTGMTTILGPGWLEGFGAFVSLPAGQIPAAADLMVVRGIMPYASLDPDRDYRWDNRARIIVADWVDDGDSVPEPAEVSVFNYGYNTGTTFEARVGLPNGRFTGRPLLWYSHVVCTASPEELADCAVPNVFAPMPYTIQVEFYDRVPWPWVTVPPTFTASSASPATWAASVAVPAGTSPGVFEGQLLITPAAGNTTAVPVSVIVPATIGPGILSTTMTTAGSKRLYDASRVNGYFDWRWRYEAGDWKLWFVDVTDPTTIALRADVSWTNLRTDVDLWSIRPDGIPNDSSFSPCVVFACDGRFLRFTRTLGTSDWVVATTQTGLGLTSPGLYTFALHEVLLGDSPAPEILTGAVSAAKLSPRGPVTVATQPGSAVSIPFALSTGFTLTNVFVTAFRPPVSSFPQTAEPLGAPSLAAGGRMTIWLNISVPADTPDGEYENFLAVDASPFVSVTVPVRVHVDATKPALAILSPAVGEVVGGAVSLEAAVADVLGGSPAGEQDAISSVSFTTGSASGPMTKHPFTGIWSGTWDTSGTPDGRTNVTIRATDAVGNQATATRGVVVDNTNPAVTISAPSAGSQLRGSVAVTWDVAEPNLEKVVLIIDREERDVTGTSTFSWNTAAVGDGSHTIGVRATDQAGNVGSRNVTVTTDNVAAAVGVGFAGGLAIGLVAAAVVGFFAGWFLRGRKRRGPPTAEKGLPAAERPATAPEPSPPAPQPPTPQGPPEEWEL